MLTLILQLSIKYFYSYTSDDKVKGYIIHGATVSEVEVDVLTGEKLVRNATMPCFLLVKTSNYNETDSLQLRRVDILEDAGQSISPLIDIGQIEGAFVMGVGLWTSEKITV